MKKHQKFYYLILILFLSAFIFSCKSTKKAATATDKEKKEEVREEKIEEKEEVVEKEEKTEREKTVEETLNSYFDEIADATSIAIANRRISQALNYFESNDTPVFVVFYREGGQKDYDRPTTIAKHLNYLKDQNKNPYKINNIVYNNRGKIEEIEFTTR